jgi:heterodisulfide reductase subunit C
MLISIECEARNGLMEREPLVERCFKCSVCAQVCPIQYLEEYSPTQSYVYDLFTCDNVLANPNLWSCASCHKCAEICPQDVNPAHVFLNLKELSFEQGLAPPSVTGLIKTIITTGSSFPTTSVTERLREQLGLAPFVVNAQEELKLIVAKTGLEEKIRKIGG